MTPWWRKWSYEVPLFISDALWEDGLGLISAPSASK